MNHNQQADKQFVPLVPEILNEPTPEDIKDFLRLHRQLSTANVSEDQIAASLKKAVSSLNTKIFIIRDDNTRIQATATGFVGYTAFGCKGWVEDVVTDESFRGRGAASTLLDSLHDWFAGQGGQTANLTSNQQRKAAGHLYERKGYAERDTRVYQMSLLLTKNT